MAEDSARLLRFNPKSRKAQLVDEQTLRRERSIDWQRRVTAARGQAERIYRVVSPILDRQGIGFMEVSAVRARLRIRFQSDVLAHKLAELVIQSTEADWEKDALEYRAIVDEMLLQFYLNNIS